jgi:hypothetical protein
LRRLLNREYWNAFEGKPASLSRRMTTTQDPRKENSAQANPRREARS